MNKTFRRKQKEKKKKRKSHFSKLKTEVKIRASLAKDKIKSEFQAGQLYGRGFKLYRKLRPMEKHIDAGICPYCTPRFKLLKNDPDILALPDGSDKQAMEIIGRKTELRTLVIEITKCPNYKRGRK